MSRTSHFVVLGLVIVVLPACQPGEITPQANGETDDMQGAEGGEGGQSSEGGAGGSHSMPPMDAAAGAAQPAGGGGGGHAAMASGGAAVRGGDGGSAGAPNTSGCAALFCEDFEGGADLDTSRWVVELEGRGSFIAVEATNPSHGRHSLHARLPSTESGVARIYEKKTFPALGGNLWGRAYFFSRTSQPSHTTFVSARAGDDLVFEIGGGNKWGLNYYSSTFSEHPTDSPTAIPNDKWMCLEWNFTTSGSQWVQLFVNGDLIRSWKPDVNYTHGPMTALALGIDNHGATPDQEVFFDDIVIDTKRIGCLTGQ